MIDETDLQLVNLLQIYPRMSWANAGRILGISATTAANRWHRLNGEGLAWITTYPNLETQFTAIVEVDCRTDTLPVVIQQLCQHPLVVSVEECTGDGDLLVWIIAPDMNSLTTLIIEWIGRLDGVHGTRSSLITEVIVGGESWRVNALGPARTSQATATRPQQAPESTPSRVDVVLAEALARDGRVSATALAHLLDAPVSSVQRRLQRLLVGGKITMRCDVAPQFAGWALECTWLATAALNHKPRIAELLRDQPSLRAGEWTTGAHNLRLTFRANTMSTLRGFEQTLAKTLPGLAPGDLVVQMRAHKSMGWLLDSAGRTTGNLVVPVFAP
ncbi:MAG: AsnC family transcriptional regulator [Propioniciclava sp.]|uniref:Lrp/AsnC family transcriptional regulator n=1 Tax=Propioniciclava sp. TaxID=2038686 RepID=UPI0039E65E5A